MKKYTTVFVIILISLNALASDPYIYFKRAISNGQTTCCLGPGDTIVIAFEIPDYPGVLHVDHWHWEFGDGGEDQNIHPFQRTDSVYHVYTAAGGGTYTINLYGINSIGGVCLTFNSITIHIHPRGYCDDPCPTADFNCGNIDYCQKPSRTFFGSATIHGCTQITAGVSWLWDFGDPASGSDNTSTSQVAFHNFHHAGLYNVSLTITGPGSCPSVRKDSTVNILFDDLHIIADPNPGYPNSPITISISGGDQNPYHLVAATLFFGDGDSVNLTSLTQVVYHTYTNDTVYHLRLHVIGWDDKCWFTDSLVIVPFPNLPCIDCIGSFDPEPGKEYLISAWVREESAGPLRTSFSYPHLTLTFYGSSDTITMDPMTAKGTVIDGWERIEERFLVPISATKMSIRLACDSGYCLFDDIRVFPFDGTMKSYTYDPVTLKLAAELDERNYATFYEYDEEGKLIRVKKETERGVMTIKEVRNHLSAKQ